MRRPISLDCRDGKHSACTPTGAIAHPPACWCACHLEVPAEVVDVLRAVPADDELAARLRHPTARALARDPVELHRTMAHALIQLRDLVDEVNERAWPPIPLDELRMLVNHAATALSAGLSLEALRHA